MNYLIALIPFLLANLVLLITYTIRTRRAREQNRIFSERLAERRRKREIQRDADELKVRELRGLNASTGTSNASTGNAGTSNSSKKTSKSSGGEAVGGSGTGAGHDSSAGGAARSTGTDAAGKGKKGTGREKDTDMALVRRVIEEETAKAGRDNTGRKVPKNGAVDVSMFPSVPRKDPGT
ncbi:MAG: hypothetical protein M1831_000889 [Alyxoria varia]|nr:MAG: hypothetical protein M1831_000889 [Alyxoria varia]